MLLMLMQQHFPQIAESFRHKTQIIQSTLTADISFIQQFLFNKMI